MYNILLHSYVDLAPMVSHFIVHGRAVEGSCRWAAISLRNIPKKPEFKIWQPLSRVALNHFLFVFVYYFDQSSHRAKSESAAAYRSLGLKRRPEAFHCGLPLRISAYSWAFCINFAFLQIVEGVLLACSSITEELLSMDLMIRFKEMQWTLGKV